MPTTFQTTLPNEDEPQLGNGVEDEIAVDRESATTNYGSVRLHYRETGATDWIDWGVVPYDRLDPVVAGLEDGERYEVRLRTETEHVIGDWTAPVAITTQFPGATNLTVTATTATSATLQFVDNADNETGVDVERREQFRDGWGEWRHVTTLDANPGTGTVEWTDDTVLPDTTYQWRVRPFTEHSAATSEATETTTADDGIRTDRVPAQGWHVVLERADGVTVEPTIVGDPQAKPVLNGLARVEIPVRRDAGWLDDQWDEATMRVWRDGRRLPIDVLERVSVSESEAALHGMGPQALDEYAELEVDFSTVHDAFAEVLDVDGITATIDDPGGQTGALEQSLPAQTPFGAALASEPTVPVRATDAGDAVELAPTTLGTEAELLDGSWSAVPDSAYDFSNGFAANIATGDASTTFEVNHRIPSEHVGVRLRRALADATGELLVAIDGTVVHGSAALAESTQPLEWVDGVGNFAFNLSPGEDRGVEPPDPPTLEPGTHEIELYIRSVSGFTDPVPIGGEWLIDYVAVYDQRFEPSWPNQTDSNDALPGPETYPESATAQFAVVEPFGAISGAQLDTAWRDGDTSGPQAIAVTNDNGQTWTRADNATALDTTFAELGPTVQAEVTLGRRSSNAGDTPTQGDETQALTSLELSVDTNDSPLVEAAVLRGSRRDICQQLASRGDVLFEAQWDADAGQIEVVVAFAGQRTSDADLDLVDYQVTKKPFERVDALRVFGRSETVTREAFVADNAGSELANSSIQEGSETVRDPSDETILERGENADYQMSYDRGSVSRTPGSQDMVSGETYEIDYSWQPSATIVATDAVGDRQRQVAIPELTSDEECREAAYFLLRELSTTPWEATVTVPRQPAGFDLIDEIAPDRLPGEGAYRVREQSVSASEITLQLGRGQTVDEAVTQLRSRLSATERTV